MMRVSIVGTGYVGLVTGACLAEKGHRVTCVDLDESKVARIREGRAPFFEPGLDDLLVRNLGARLEATTELERAVQESDLTLVAVGTPFDGESIDLGQVRDASRQIGRALRGKDGYHVVAVKSTVVPGTTDEVVSPILEEASGRKAGPELGVGTNPEFLREGEAVTDFMEPDRIVIGGIDDRTRSALRELYRVFGEADRIETNNRTAEMIKYASNSLFATLISFSNEIGNLCAGLAEVDVLNVLEGVHRDRRLSPLLGNGERQRPGVLSYLAAGCGFGGSCFPKDVRALVAYGRNRDLPMDLLQAVVGVNERQPSRLTELVRRHFPRLRGVRVTVLGLAFKPGTDDMRHSPAIPVVQELLTAGARVRAYDPKARAEAERVFAGLPIEYAEDLAEAVRGADAILLVTRWPEFERLPDLLDGLPDEPVVVDGRRMLDPGRLTRYEGIGLGRDR